MWKHGASGYGNHGCRCRTCRDGWAERYGLDKVRRGRRLGRCKVSGCDEYQRAKGMCHAHYERQRTGRPVNVVIARRPGARVYD